MKLQKIKLSLGFAFSIAQFVLFYKVMADLSTKLPHSVLETSKKRKAEVLCSTREAEPFEESSHTDAAECARVSLEQSSGSRSSSQKDFRKINTQQFWACKYLRPPRAVPRRSLGLKPIHPPTEEEVASCLSPLAFTVLKTPADFHRVPKIFTPLSILELFQFYGSEYLIDLSDRGVALDQIIATEFESFRTKHSAVQKKFSPMLSYISVQISQRMGPWLEHHWHQIGSTFSTHEFSAQMNSQTDMMLFLPFIYQLLSQKPSLEQWFIIENFFIVFLVYWKLQFLYHNRELTELKYFEKSQILEKKAKGMMWLSEVLSNMFVPDFLALIAGEKMRFKEANKEIKSKPRGARSQSPLMRLFEYLAGITSKTGTKSGPNKSNTCDVYRKRLIISELLKLWQQDCHNGFPLQARTTNQRIAMLRLMEGQKRTTESNRPFWDNWCSASIDISLQSQLFSSELRKPSQAFMNMNKIRVGEKLFGTELDWEARMRLLEFEGAALKQPSRKCTSIMGSILNLIPDLPINIPGKINSPEVFAHLLRYDRFYSEIPTQLPELCKKFFYQKGSLESDWKFWVRFEQRKKSHVRQARNYKNRRTQKSNNKQYVDRSA